MSFIIKRVTKRNSSCPETKTVDVSTFHRLYGKQYALSFKTGKGTNF